jgi:hypothetical protein
MAFAYFRDGRLCYFDHVKELEKIPDRDVDYVVTEDPYPGGDIRKHSHGIRAESYKHLCFAVGMVIQYAKSIHAEYRLIRPVDWKSFYSLTAQTPVQIQETIRTQLSKVKDDRDIQDAILIGRYFIEHMMAGLENT